MKIYMRLLVATLIVVISGCASATYKSRNEGLSRFGYEETKTGVNEYNLDYYGAKSDKYEKLEQLWRQRAEYLCKSKKYQSSLTRETYEGKTFVLLPPFIYFENTDWPLLKGKLACSS